MVLSINELIKVLRNTVNVQNVEVNEDGETVSIIDTAYLAMSDDDLMLYVKLGVSRMYPGLSSLDNLPEDCSTYALNLLAQMELFKALAVMNANDVDMGADNNNYLKQDQRYQHYMKLLAAAQDDYDNWLENEGTGTVQTYDLINTHYAHTKRNYELQQKPIVSISVDEVTDNTISISWDARMDHFGKYMLLFREGEPNIDVHMEVKKGMYSDETQILRNTYDKRNNAKLISGLQPNHTYYLAVIAMCRNGVWGYKEVSVTTLDSEPNQVWDEEVEDSLGEIDEQPEITG